MWAGKVRFVDLKASKISFQPRGARSHRLFLSLNLMVSSILLAVVNLCRPHGPFRPTFRVEISEFQKFDIIVILNVIFISGFEISTGKALSFAPSYNIFMNF